jgi:hypothetical protein
MKKKFLSLLFAAITISQISFAETNTKPGMSTGVEGIVDFTKIQDQTTQNQSVYQQYQSLYPSLPGPLDENNMGLADKIEGRWKHSQSATSIKLQKNHYVFCNEDNDCANGYSIIYVPKWNVIGKLTKDGRTIIWSNGTRWRR